MKATTLDTLMTMINEKIDIVEKDLDMTTEAEMYHFYSGVIAGLASVVAMVNGSEYL